MSHRRTRTAIVLWMVMLLVFGAPGALAGPARHPSVQTASVGSKISYQGQLLDAAGNPVSGSYTLRFELYAAATGGTALWQQTFSAVQVQNGLFSVQLTVDPDDLDGSALWLEIIVNGEHLSPRQELLAAPYALTLRPGAVVHGDEAKPLLDLRNDDGIGLSGYSEASYGVYGETTDDSQYVAAGVRGHSTHESTAGVMGTSESGFGVYGQITDSGNTHSAVLGYSEGLGKGVSGYSMNSIGVYGQTESAEAYGGSFANTAEGGAGMRADGGTGWDADVVLGGDFGTVYSDPQYSSSDVKIYSQNNVTVDLDENDDEESWFSVWGGDNEWAFAVNEDGHAMVARTLTVGTALWTKGAVCWYLPVSEAGLYPMAVPDFCLDAFCWIMAEFDAPVGAFYPGLTWPTAYAQWQESAWGDESWIAGPNMNIAGVGLGGGPGINGDGISSRFGFELEDSEGGLFRLLDDSTAENDADKWTVEFQPSAGGLGQGRVYACPLGQPVAEAGPPFSASAMPSAAAAGLP